jgi:hypothetical protein
VLFFGVYVILDGIFSLFAAISRWRHREDRWLLLLESVIAIWAGMVTLRTPAITAVMLVLLIAVWAMATGSGGSRTSLGDCGMRSRVGRIVSRAGAQTAQSADCVLGPGGHLSSFSFPKAQILELSK